MDARTIYPLLTDENKARLAARLDELAQQEQQTTTQK